MSSPQKFENWLRPEPSGLYCEPGDFYIDPLFPVDRAIVTHGHVGLAVAVAAKHMGPRRQERERCGYRAHIAEGTHVGIHAT